MQPRDEVDEVGEDSGHDERIGSRSNKVGKLNVQLLPSVVDPATLNNTGVDAVKTNDISSTEEGVRQKTEHAGDAMLSEDIQRVIDTNPVLD